MALLLPRRLILLSQLTLTQCVHELIAFGPIWADGLHAGCGGSHAYNIAHNVARCGMCQVLRAC